MSDAHITDVPAIDVHAPAGASHVEIGQRIKSAAPAAGAIGVIAAIVAGAMIVTTPGEQTPPPGDPSEAAIAPPPGEQGAPSIQYQTPPGPLGQRTVELVVKFKDDGKVKDIIDAFWRDPASAQSRFEAWKSGRPEFAKLRLERVTYSNELVLVLADGVAAADRPAAIRDIVKALGAASDISYAEQQTTMAHPGGQ